MERNKRHLFTFSFKCAALSGLVLGFLWIFCIPYAPDLGAEERYVVGLSNLKLPEDRKPYDLIFFGNSHCYTAYDPTLIGNRLGLRSIHINSSAQRLETSLAIADEILATTDFKFAVFDVSDGVQLRPKLSEEDIWYYQTLALQEVSPSWKKAWFISDFFPLGTYPEYALTAFSKELGRLFRLNRIGKYGVKHPAERYQTPTKGILFSYNGFWASDHTPVSKERFPVQFNREPGPEIGIDSLWSTALMRKLEEFIAKASKRKVEVLLVNSMKLHPTNFNRIYMDSLLRKYANVRFLNLNTQRANYRLDEKSFYNSTHLNYSGSHQVTRRLCDSLSKWYAIDPRGRTALDFGIAKVTDVFYSLDSLQDKFIKLTFNRLPEELRGYQLVISLFPRDSSQLSPYAKKRGFRSENFYITDPLQGAKEVGSERVLIKRLKTDLTEDDLERMRVYFYKPKDSLHLPSLNVPMKTTLK